MELKSTIQDCEKLLNLISGNLVNKEIKDSDKVLYGLFHSMKKCGKYFII